jgi:O-antigen ligase
MLTETADQLEVPKYLRLAIIGGFYIFMAAWFIAPSRSAHHTIIYLAFLLPALLHLAFCIFTNKPSLRGLKSQPYLALIIFLTYLVITTTWSDIAEPIPHYIKRMAQTLLFVYGAFIICRYETRHFWGSLYSSMFLCVLWLGINLTFFSEEAFISDRFKGANAGIHYLLTGALLGAFFVLGITRLIQLMELRSNQIFNALLFLASCIVLYAVLLTESRSALLALAVTAIYWMASSRQIKRFKIVAIALLAIAGALIVPYLELFISRGFSQRFEIWAATWQWILEKPWLGHGFGAEFILQVSSNEELYDAHNIHLEVLFEGGVIGGGLWLFFLGTLAWQGWHHRRTHLGQCLIALLIYSVSVKFFESRGILSRPTEFWHLLWLCTGMAIAVAMQPPPTLQQHSGENPNNSL